MTYGLPLSVSRPSTPGVADRRPTGARRNVRRGDGTRTAPCGCRSTVRRHGAARMGKPANRGLAGRRAVSSRGTRRARAGRRRRSDACSTRRRRDASGAKRETRGPAGRRRPRRSTGRSSGRTRRCRRRRSSPSRTGDWAMASSGPTRRGARRRPAPGSTSTATVPSGGGACSSASTSAMGSVRELNGASVRLTVPRLSPGVVHATCARPRVGDVGQEHRVEVVQVQPAVDAVLLDEAVSVAASRQLAAGVDSRRAMANAAPCQRSRRRSRRGSLAARRAVAHALVGRLAHRAPPPRQVVHGRQRVVAGEPPGAVVARDREWHDAALGRRSRRPSRCHRARQSDRRPPAARRTSRELTRVKPNAGTRTVWLASRSPSAAMNARSKEMSRS